MTQKPEQVAVLEPRGELRFKGPFTEVTTARLQIKNPTDRALAFKVKTTAPKRYCVRPNNGLIAPAKTVDIAVMLQPFDFETHSQERNKHKFMVQTMYVPDGEYLNGTDALWRDVRPDEVMDSKLKCVFDMPGIDMGSNSGDQNENENQLNYDLSSALGEQPSSQRSSGLGSDPSAPPPPYSSSLNNGALEQETARLNEENRVLRDQLSAARREVVTLKEDSLRQRKLAAGSTPSSATTSSPGVSNTSRVQHGGHNEQAIQGIGGYPPILVVIVAIVLGVIIGKLII